MSQELRERNLQITADYKKYLLGELKMWELVVKWKLSANRIRAIGQFYASKI